MCNVNTGQETMKHLHHCMGKGVWYSTAWAPLPESTTNTGAQITLRSKLELRATPPPQPAHSMTKYGHTPLLSHTETPPTTNTLHKLTPDVTLPGLDMKLDLLLGLVVRLLLVVGAGECTTPQQQRQHTHTGPPTSVGRNS